MKHIVRTWAIAQIAIGMALIALTAHYVPPAFERMREESRQTGANLVEIADALAAVRTTYAESATNLFATSDGLEDVEAKLQDAGGKIGDVGHVFEKRGQKFERSERHNRESKMLWGKVETPFNDSIANVYGDLKEWTLAASTNLCDVGRDLSHVSKSIGAQRKAIAKFQKDGHPKTLQAMETSSRTIGHVGEMLSSCDSITALGKSIYILSGVIALLFIGNGVVLLVASSSLCPKQSSL
jgi:hypothetical protein